MLHPVLCQEHYESETAVRGWTSALRGRRPAHWRGGKTVQKSSSVGVCSSLRRWTQHYLLVRRSAGGPTPTALLGNPWGTLAWCGGLAACPSAADRGTRRCRSHGRIGGGKQDHTRDAAALGRVACAAGSKRRCAAQGSGHATSAAATGTITAVAAGGCLYFVGASRTRPVGRAQTLCLWLVSA